MTVNINKPQIDLREQLKKLERPTTNKLAVKGHDGVLLDPLTGELNLQGIDSVVEGAAVDVFVYDTSKDSDGGAWRKRTQSTSWYNEALNTSTRGSRKEFPAIAVIVAELGKVTIYDGDDPDLPMWMVFKRSSGANSTMLGYSGTWTTSCYMLNGILCVGHWNGGWGISVIRFLSDSQSWLWAGSAYSYPETGQNAQAIIQRNDELHWTAVTGANSGIINGFIYDVAMTVLPNAPVDSATGLPVPTIAVGTNGGVSVIRDDGNIYDITSPSINDGVGNIQLDSEYVYFTSPDSGVATEDRMLFVYGITSADINNTFGYNDGDDYLFTTFNSPSSVPSLAIKGSVDGDIANMVVYDKKIFSALPSGLAYLDVYSTTTLDGSVAYITKDYNTGWMQGDIKGAFLSDTDTTDSIEYVQNGYFNSNVNHWTIGSTGTTATLSSNRLLITAPTSGGSFGYVYQAITTEVGKTYKIELYYDRGTVDGRVTVRNDTTNTGANSLFYTELGASADGKTYYNTFTATATTTYILLYAMNASGGTSAYDRVSVTLEKDRSVNSKGLRVYGTVSKNPVLPGAELIAYSGWTTSNFMVQSNNSDLNFGTGDFSIALWTRRDSTGTHVILEKGNGATNQFYLYISAQDDVRFSAGGVGTSVYGNIENDIWYQIIMVRRSGVVYGYLNGELKASNSNTGTVTSSDADFYIGKTVGNQYPFDGSIALVRVSGTAPSPEQIKKMYEDEKCLFQENAKATLHGSSDAVTALAYDDTTNLLHVGTSGGRSTFSGLKRVENTTTAVATAISASNGLVAEQ